MTQPPPLPPPPFGDDTDEALSALLDGELGAFADDHGLTEAEARDRLEQWSEYPARLAALEHGRAAVGEPVAALDDLTRRRLVRTALPAADGIGATSNRSGWSWLRISAAAAAAAHRARRSRRDAHLPRHRHRQRQREVEQRRVGRPRRGPAGRPGEPR